MLSQGALRNAIAAFIHVSPVMKDNIWRYLEQYDLPVVVGSHVGNTAQPITGQVSFFCNVKIWYLVDEMCLEGISLWHTIYFSSLLLTVFAFLFYSLMLWCYNYICQNTEFLASKTLMHKKEGLRAVHQDRRQNCYIPLYRSIKPLCGS